jgi:hypothetical protein
MRPIVVTAVAVALLQVAPIVFGHPTADAKGKKQQRRENERDDAEACTPGYEPCIPPGPDVDCAGGSGDGPRYVEGPIRVTGSDPYGLDRDRDGIGCE